MLKSLLTFGKDKTLLVCETDGFLLRAAVMVKAGNDCVPIYRAQSMEADMADAVEDVIRQVKADGWMGEKAVLLSPTVLSTLIELPVNPKKPRPVQQMQELIRWEAESLLMQHTTQWSVGNMLVGRGYMTAEQAAAVMDLQQGRPNPAGGIALADSFSLRRFGELAEELGYIKRSQLNACLAGQEWLKSDDDAIECGWSAQGEVADIPGTYNWLVSCVNKGLLQRWSNVFNKQGVTLQAMYPLMGICATLVEDNVEPCVIMESHQGAALVAQIEDSELVAQNLYINPAKQALECCLESYHALNPNSSDRVWLANWNDDESNLADDLTHTLACEVSAVSDPAISDKLSPGMLAAAKHAFKFSGSTFAASVRLGGPLPDLWQRVEVRVVALIVVVILTIMAAETSLFVRERMVTAQKKEVDAQWHIIDSAMKRIKADIKQVEQRKKQLESQQIDQNLEQQRLAFFGEQLPERAQLVQAILGILQQTVDDDVVLNSIDEMGKRATLMPVVPHPNKDSRVEVENFNVEAWALNETAAQTFIQAIEDAIEPWDMEVRDSQVSANIGPLSLDGFVVSMRLVKLLDPNTVKQGKSR